MSDMVKRAIEEYEAEGWTLDYETTNIHGETKLVFRIEVEKCSPERKKELEFYPIATTKEGVKIFTNFVKIYP